MILGFRHKGLKKLYEDNDRSKLPAAMVNKIARILADLDDAACLEDLDLPSYRLHQLSGDRAGEWSIKVTGNWRIVFRINEEGIFDVNFEDYH